MSKINTLNMARWILALRSGRYKQASQALQTSFGFCCLGVVCQISKLGTWDKELGANRYVVKTPTNGQFTDASVTKLPHAVAEWLGLHPDLTNPEIEPGVNAMYANDQLGLTFAQIADKLEAFYLNGQSAEVIVAAAKAEAKGWLTLAEAHDPEFSPSVYLCNTIKHADAYGVSTVAAIPADVRSAMLARIKANLGDSCVAYDGEDMTDLEERESRVLACLMFAQQAANGVA